MRTLWQAVLMTGLVTLLMGCATEEYSSVHPGAYASNVFYCASYPSYGIDCPGGFYYNNVFFPDRYVFFKRYHIDRHHWHEFHGRRHWDRDDWERTETIGNKHWQPHRVGKKTSEEQLDATVAWPEAHRLSGREPGAANGGQPPLPDARREFPGNPAFGPGSSSHTAPYGFLWRRN